MKYCIVYWNDFENVNFKLNNYNKLLTFIDYLTAFNYAEKYLTSYKYWNIINLDIAKNEGLKNDY